MLHPFRFKPDPFGYNLHWTTRTRPHLLGKVNLKMLVGSATSLGLDETNLTLQNSKISGKLIVIQ